MPHLTQASTLVGCAIAFSALTASAVPDVPGFTVDTYAAVDLPMRLSFDDGGVLFVGSNVTYPTPGPITRVGPGGAPVTPYGPGLRDPDAVIAYDPSGLVAADSGSVFAGGVWNSARGHITEVRVDETGQETFTSSAPFFNPSKFAYDSLGRLLFSDVYSDEIFVSTGGDPTVLFSTVAKPFGMAIDSLDRIFVWSNDDVVRIYDSAGTLVDDAFATGIGGEGMAFGPGGVWGNDLYLMAGGDLLRYDSTGAVTVMGTGFSVSAIRDLEFGPGGALYVSDYPENRVLRVTPSGAVNAPLATVATGTRLFQNSPNPFAHRTVVGFSLAQREFAEVDVYDVTGRHVRRVHAGTLAAGTHGIPWDGEDETGTRVGSGVYYYQLRLDGVPFETKKAIVRR